MTIDPNGKETLLRLRLLLIQQLPNAGMFKEQVDFALASILVRAA